mmetsp:Transcript_11059/g.41233  ORF Transcript_11059/g.41233 Transcript_11059/m.41233 type:complete len:1610 (-) Transcript_11059:1501-6330(-)|eukprot:CAMPEP_0117439054 /NCGR_PEP_ID=MMETSP0759-20121206/2371_1 /TAXON_ID=63605 /ORGANISM="Percolomonas cosmopolitus, Strain WS" /LENGTH=1609 /DNA_ID=CAMNT_0005230765 /DNA_START=270 /DNA_END=5099 /DNA_ORIENTATION=+
MTEQSNEEHHLNQTTNEESEPPNAYGESGNISHQEHEESQVEQSETTAAAANSTLGNIEASSRSSDSLTSPSDSPTPTYDTKNMNGKRLNSSLKSPKRRNSTPTVNELKLSSLSHGENKRHSSFHRSHQYTVTPSTLKSNGDTLEDCSLAPLSLSLLSSPNSSSPSTPTSSSAKSSQLTSSRKLFSTDPSHGVPSSQKAPSTTTVTPQTDDDSATSNIATLSSPVSSKRFIHMSEEDKSKYAKEIDSQERHPTQDESRISSPNKPPVSTPPIAPISLRDQIRDVIKHPLKHKRLAHLKRSYVFHSNPTSAQKKKFPSNEIRTTKYRWYSFFFLNLLEQYREYSNIYFLFIMILSLLPGLSPVAPITAILPVIFILSANMFREGVQDILRWREDKKSNFEKCTVFRSGKWITIPKKSLRVGEFVKVLRKQDVPADIIVLSSSNAEGLCFIETSNLDGETTMKIKNARSETNNISSEDELSKLHLLVACQPPNKQFDFSGTISMDDGQHTEALMYDHFVPRSSTLLNTDQIVGLVTYTGKNTKMFLNLKKTKTKFSLMQKTLNKIFFGIIILNQFFAAMMVLGSLLFQQYTTQVSWYLFDNDAPSFEMAFTNYLTALILLNLMIPMSLYVSLEFVKMIQARFMTWDEKMKHMGSPLAVYSNNLNSDLAKIEIIFSDKTGTLTENKMRFKYSSIDMIRFDESKQKGSLEQYAKKDECDKEMQEKIHMLLFCLSVCHTIIPHELKEGEEDEGEDVADNSSNDQVDIELEDLPPGSDNSLTLGDDGFTGTEVTPQRGSSARWSDRNWETSPDFPAVQQDGSVIDDNVHSTPHISSTSEDAASPKHDTPSARRIRFDGESPDEIALINFAKANNYVLTRRAQDSITVEINGEEKQFKILALMPFSSRRKRMSVVIREPESDKIIVFTKGADSEMMSCLEQNRENALHRNKATELLTSFSKEGLRTLVMSYKTITQEEFDTWHKDWHEAENALDDRNIRMDDTAITIESHGYTLLGTTAIEDCLQEMVPETLRFFREAGVQIWMLTGDKMETAINIGRSSEMISSDAQQFILNVPLPPNFDDKEVSNEIEHQLDRILEYRKPYFVALQGKLLDICLLKNKNLEKKFVESVRYAETVICCRSTPDQKAMLVKLGRRRLKKLGLAVGDGANDVSMIQQARVGVGIRGREGSQAARASDFSIARFYLMKRLLSVHGHWSYYRSAKFVQYSFYKNMLVTFYQILFTIFNGFTMQTLIDSWILTFYNVIFTLLIPFVFGIFEKDIPDNILEQDPRIYTATLKERIFSSEASFAWIFRAFLHSTIVFFVVIMFTDNTGLGDLWTQAALLSLTANWVIVLKAFLEMKYHTVIHYFSLWFSVVSMHVFYAIYSAFPYVPTTGAIAYYITFSIHTNIAFYLVLPLAVVMCLIPELAWKLLINMVRPKVRTKLKTEYIYQQKKELRRKRRKGATRLSHTAAEAGAVVDSQHRTPLQQRHETLHAVDEAFGVTGVSSKFSPTTHDDDAVSHVTSDTDEVRQLGTPHFERDHNLISVSPYTSVEYGNPPPSPFVLDIPTILNGNADEHGERDIEQIQNSDPQAAEGDADEAESKESRAEEQRDEAAPE